jgi:uncharacterized membrane protein
VGVALGIAIVAMALVAYASARSGKTEYAEVARTDAALDEARRVLASRYARGEITFDEYERMCSLLRT